MEFRTPAWLAALGTVASLPQLLAPSSAHACDPAPPPSYLPNQIEFATVDGEAARDGVLIISGEQVPEGDAQIHRLDVHVTRADDLTPVAPAPGVVDAYSLPGAATWWPAEPLDAGTAYVAVVQALDDQDEPIEEPVEKRFTTSHQFLPPLTMQGPIGVTLEQYVTDIVCESQDSCGQPSDCHTELQRHVRARVRLPAIQGGWTRDGYGVSILLVDKVHFDPSGDVEHHVETDSWHQVDAETVADLVVDVPQDTEAYDACITVVVRDEARGELERKVECFEVPALGELTAWEDGMDPVSSSGCSAAAGPGTTGAWWPLLTLAGLSWRRRRSAVTA